MKIMSTTQTNFKTNQTANVAKQNVAFGMITPSAEQKLNSFGLVDLVTTSRYGKKKILKLMEILEKHPLKLDCTDYDSNILALRHPNNHSRIAVVENLNKLGRTEWKLTTNITKDIFKSAIKITKEYDALKNMPNKDAEIRNLKTQLDKVSKELENLQISDKIYAKDTNIGIKVNAAKDFKKKSRLSVKLEKKMDVLDENSTENIQKEIDNLFNQRDFKKKETFGPYDVNSYIGATMP